MDAEETKMIDIVLTSGQLDGSLGDLSKISDTETLAEWVAASSFSDGIVKGLDSLSIEGVAALHQAVNARMHGEFGAYATLSDLVESGWLDTLLTEIAILTTEDELADWSQHTLEELGPAWAQCLGRLVFLVETEGVAALHYAVNARMHGESSSGFITGPESSPQGGGNSSETMTSAPLQKELSENPYKQLVENIRKALEESGLKGNPEEFAYILAQNPNGFSI